MFLILNLPTISLQARSISCTKDTTKLKRIEYDFVKYSYNAPDKTGNSRQRRGQRAYYILEGDTLDKDFTVKNLLKDIPLKKYKKEIKKARRQAFWRNILGGTFLFGLPILSIVGAVLLLTLKKLTPLQVGLVVLGGLVLLVFSFFVVLVLAFTQVSIEQRLMNVVDRYNEEISQ